jgi:hypothetical protein
MHRIYIAALAATFAFGALAGLPGQAIAQGVTAYEGARVIWATAASPTTPRSS